MRVLPLKTSKKIEALDLEPLLDGSIMCLALNIMGDDLDRDPEEFSRLDMNERSMVIKWLSQKIEEKMSIVVDALS